jgi:hypothetical protein
MSETEKELIAIILARLDDLDRRLWVLEQRQPGPSKLRMGKDEP